MKITFIRPSMSGVRSSDAMQPLAFAVLAGLTPDDVEVELFDERLEAVPMDTDTDLVAMTVETFTAKRAYEIADRFRARGVPVVMGGYHPTFLPDETLGHADAVVVGDAEGQWNRVVEDARRGQMHGVYRRATYPPLNGVVYDHSIFEGKPYVRVPPVQYGRGCKFACDFCSIHAFYGTNLRQRPVREVVAEIEALGAKHVFFVDDNIFVDVPRAKELFRALVPLGIKWSCQVSIDVAKNDELMGLMAKSGCITALIGFEWLSEKNLKQMKKQWNLRHGDYATTIQKFGDRGIMIYATFVFGYDEDTPEAFGITLDFALRSKFYLANFNPLAPTPGTRLYDRLERDGRLIYDRWWLHPEYRYGRAMFHPRGMTADQLTEGCFRARREFNTVRAIAGRALKRTNASSLYRLGLYLMSNAISRREIYRKQDQRLGASSSAKARIREADVDQTKHRSAGA
jgi:radical SAM superfamily enzyme YgiQ (UPF0313 family)